MSNIENREHALPSVRWYKSIKIQSVLIIAIAAVIVFTSAAYLSHIQLKETVKQDLVEHVRAAVQEYAYDIDQDIFHYVDQLTSSLTSHTPQHFLGEVLSGTTTPLTHSHDEVRHFLERANNEGVVWKRIDIVDTTGTIHLSSDENRSVTEQQTSFNVESFLSLPHQKVNEALVYDIENYPSVGDALLVIVPIYNTERHDTEQEIIGYGVGYLSVTQLFENIHTQGSYIDDGIVKNVYLLSSDDTTVYHKGDGQRAVRTNLIQYMRHGTDDFYTPQTTNDDKYTLFLYTYLDGFYSYNGFGWMVIFEIATRPVDTQLQNIAYNNILLYIPAIIIAAFLIYGFLHYTVVAPLFVINKQLIQSIASGEMKKIDLQQGNEVGIFVKGFNVLIQQIKERTERLTKTIEQSRTLNKELEKTKSATLNVLEDLDEEKKKVDEVVEQRTRELLSERSKLRHVTDNMPVGVILINSNGEAVFANKEVTSLLNIHTDDSNKALAFLKKKFPTVVTDTVIHACTTGQSEQFDEVENEDGIFEIAFRCDVDENDKTSQFSGKGVWIRDVTEEKQLERSKSELVAVASHQLRTPLTVTRGNLEMLIDGSFGKISKKQGELLQDAEDSVIRLIEMVNDMLDITKIEKGDVPLHIEKIAIVEVLETVIQRLQSHAEKQHFTVNFEKPKEALYVSADRSRLEQVFQNLIDNAIRYSSEKNSKIDISVHQKKTVVDIVLTDNGIGIPKIEQKDIFKRFYRASNAVKSISGSSGLGLFIVKEFIEMMNGKVTFVSAENEGTTFTIALPRAK